MTLFMRNGEILPSEYQIQTYPVLFFLAPFSGFS